MGAVAARGIGELWERTPSARGVGGKVEMMYKGWAGLCLPAGSSRTSGEQCQEEP